MSKIVDWVEMDPNAPEPDPMPKCPIGHNGHRWLLNIEEGQIGLRLADGEVCPPYKPTGYPDRPRPVCEWHIDDYHESINMEDVYVSLTWHVEHICGEVDAYVIIAPEAVVMT